MYNKKKRIFLQYSGPDAAQNLFTWVGGVEEEFSSPPTLTISLAGAATHGGAYGALLWILHVAASWRSHKMSSV